MGISKSFFQWVNVIIIDGEELRMECRKCGTKFNHIIGYGPIFPTPWLRHRKLRKHPPVCPNCGLTECSRVGLLERIKDWLV